MEMARLFLHMLILFRLAGDVVSNIPKMDYKMFVDIAVSVNGYFKPEDPDETDDLIYLNEADKS